VIFAFVSSLDCLSYTSLRVLVGNTLSDFFGLQFGLRCRIDCNGPCSHGVVFNTFVEQIYEQ